MANRRRGLGYRVGNWMCRAIAVECLGGEAYYAIRAGAGLSVALLAAAGIGARFAIRRITRRR